MLTAGVPWVGRSQELDQLRWVWARSQHGLRAVTITGEPGIGKTRLAGEFLAELSDQVACVLRGRCAEFLDIAQAPFAEMLRADLRDRISVEELAQDLGARVRDLARLLPELAEVVPSDSGAAESSDPTAARMHLLEALVRWLRSASAAHPVCLFIDDVHWADAETVTVLEHLFRACPDLPVMVLLTSRWQGDARADDLLTGLLQPSESIARIPLAGLSDEEVDLLLAAETSAQEARPLSSDFAHWVRDVAGGNPLLVWELARQGSSALPDDAAPARRGLPARLADVIRQRAGRLSAPANSCLSAAAVIGREFDPAVLADATGMSITEVDRHLADAASASLVEEHTVAPLRYRFCHDAVREALYDAIGPLQRSDLHRRVGHALLDRVPAAESESHHLAIGHHFGRSSDPVLVRHASEHLRRGADLSSQRRAYAAAARLYGRAEALLDDATPIRERCDLMIARGLAEFYSGAANFRNTLLDAAREAARAGEVDALVRAVIANHRGWYSSTTDLDRERLELIDVALLRCPPTERESLARLNAMWAMENVRDPAERARVLERSITAVQIAEEVADPDLLIDILCDRFSVLYAGFEDPHGCVELAQRIERLARARGDESHLLNAAIAVAQSTMMTGDFATSDAALMLSESLAARVHRPVRHWLARVWIATRTAMRGDLEQGEALAGAALDYGLSLEQPDAFTWYAGQLFSLRFLGNRLDELVDAIEEQVAEHAAAVPAWQAGLALAFATVGRTEEARRIVDEFVSCDLVNLPNDMIRLQGLAFLATAVATLEDADAARTVYGALVGYAGMFAHNGTIDAGPVDLHLGALAVAFGDLDLAQKHLSAAAAQCGEVDARAWLPHVARWSTNVEALTQRRNLVVVPAPEPFPIVPEATAEIRVLGTFTVVGADGTQVRWRSRKARTLLKLLVASRGSAVRREYAMHQLWPDQDPERLANRFAVALATVRRALDPARAWPTGHHVEMQDDVLRLDLDHVRIDLEQFEALASAEDRESLRSAVALYRGDPFLDEDDVATWSGGVRAQAQVTLCQALTRLATIEAERGDLAAAAGLFRKALEGDPFAEVASRGLADVLMRMGAHAQAGEVEADLARRLAELESG